MDVDPPAATRSRRPRWRALARDDVKVVLAAAFGTVFEWYDFYLYALLAPVFARNFFANLDPSLALICALAIFSAGFLMRPFGAALFGRIGDRIGRKRAFLLTVLLMGAATFGIGLLPTQASIGVAAPLALAALRLVQGLAIGGEYGGAATYVAEHAPSDRRGLYTAFVQTTASLGLFSALAVVYAATATLGDDAMAQWGWRLPFLLSSGLLAASLWVRASLAESPAFVRLANGGEPAPWRLRDLAAERGLVKRMLAALFGLVAGQAVVWYTGQIFVLLYLQQTLHIDAATALALLGIALLVSTPFFIVFGALSDRIGRKRIILAGLLLAALTYFPIFGLITEFGNPALASAMHRAPVVVVADRARCSLLGGTLGAPQARSPCDVARAWLGERGIPYTLRDGGGANALVFVGRSEAIVAYLPGAPDAGAQTARYRAQMEEAIYTQGRYPRDAESGQTDKTMLALLLTLLTLYVTMVYGPLAAALVEMFPTRVRCTAVSLPYHVGNGWFGGLMPTIAFAVMTTTGDPYRGLWYAVGVALATLVIGAVTIDDQRGRDLG